LFASSDGVADMDLELRGAPVALHVNGSHANAMAVDEEPEEGAAVQGEIAVALSGAAAAAASQPGANMSLARAGKQHLERLTNPNSISQFSSRALRAFQVGVSSLQQCIVGFLCLPFPSVTLPTPFSPPFYTPAVQQLPHRNWR
jgi:hypothetical protein